jgi:hypothetical protein
MPLQRYVLVGDTDDTAGRSGTSVASLEGLLALSLAKVIGAGMCNNSTTDDAVGADQLDQVVRHAALGVALGIGLNVAKVAHVAVLVGRAAVRLSVRVEVRASRRAAVGVVTESVDVEATLGVGVVASKVPRDGRGLRLGSLLEGDGSGDLGVTPEDSNYRL